MESSDHADEQFRSFSHLEECRAGITHQALRLLAEDPTLLLAGYIIEDGAAELPRDLFRTRQPLGTSGFVGVSGLATRDSMREFLRKASGAAAVEWFDRFPADAPRHLPVVSVLRHGIRMAGLPLPKT